MLDGNAASALDLVSVQSEAGKDLGRLLADLVSLCRDLLVSEVTAKDLPGRRGELIAPLRGKFTARKLTELLEVLSAAEAGLRFSPDKKLPLEIAVIKGIQLLHTADLDEVLDTLAGLRSGETAPVSVRPAVAPRAAAPKPAPPAAVAKPAPAAAAPQSPVFAAAPAAPMTGSVRDIWQKVVAEISEKQSIRSAWLEEAQDMCEESGSLRVVFPASKEKQIRTPVAKEQGLLIQELWEKLTGRKVAFRPEATGEVVAEKPKISAAVPTADDFENDPGIEAAIELFGATLEPDDEKS
jgi:DNA polymerase-3 subunit gamma/tau